MIEYTGLADENIYIGPVTGARYKFGLLSRRRGYIDPRDSAILAAKEDGLPVFRHG